MLSEIPQLQVVTAILDSDEEDFISQLLFNQGWSIIYRAIDAETLTNFLDSRNALDRTVLVYKSDLPGWNAELIEPHKGSNFTEINLDQVSTTSNEIMGYIRSHVRTPLVHEGSTSESGSDRAANGEGTRRRVYTITGTSGAPGRSTLAINLAEELSLKMSVDLLDADVKAPSLPYLLRQHLATHPHREGHHPIEIMDSALKDRNSGVEFTKTQGAVIVDIGVLPPLDELLTDRRWQAILLNQIMNESTALIYLASSTGISLIRLEEFMRKFPLMLRKVPIIYLLNQSGVGRIDRAVEERFLALVEGEKHLIMPTNSLLNKRQERDAMNSLLRLLHESDR